MTTIRTAKISKLHARNWLPAAFVGTLLSAFVFSGQVHAEGSSDLIKRGKGNRAALLAVDPVLGIQAPDGRGSTSLHFAYAQEGEVLNLSSSAQGVGQGAIVYRDPTGMSGRCDASVGQIANLAMEKSGAGAGTPCEVPVNAGQAGIWEVEFLPPSNAVDLAAYEVLGARDQWQPQKPTDFWVRAWDVSVSKGSVKSGGSIVPGRTFVRSFTAIVGAEGTPTPWNSIWFGRSSDGFIYALDSNGLEMEAINLLATSRGLKDAQGNSIYASAPTAELGGSLSILDPYAVGNIKGEQALKLFYGKPDKKLPETALSALMGEEWLNGAIPEGQTMAALTFDAATKEIKVTVEGEGISNALELFAADATGEDAAALHTFHNLAVGESVLTLPEGVAGDVVGRFTSKVAEMHFPLANVPVSKTGLRVRRMNGSKQGAGDLFWNLGEEPGRFNGAPAQVVNSLRGQAGLWAEDLGRGRVNSIWAMSPVSSEISLSLPKPQADVRVSFFEKSIEPSDVGGEQNAVVELVVTNDGPSKATGLEVTLGATDNMVLGAAEGAVLDGNIIKIDKLNPAGFVRVAVDVTVKAVDQPLVANITAASAEDPNADNNSGSITFAPLPESEPEVEVVSETIEEPADAPEAEVMVADEAASPEVMLDNEAPKVESKPAEDTMVAAETGAEGDAEGIELISDLIALRKRTDSDQAEVDLIFELRNGSATALENLSLVVAPARHLGEAFISLVGEPMIEAAPQMAGSNLSLNTGFSGFAGADNVLQAGGVLQAGDSAVIRLTMHYDPDSVTGIQPFSMRGDVFGKINGAEVRIPSDNDLGGLEKDENGDGNLANDATPLPGLRLVKSVLILPGPVTSTEDPTDYDAVFEFTLENTGAIMLEDLALADLFQENPAITEILNVDVIGVTTESESFTATGLPPEFVGLNSVQRFTGGEAKLLPGESATVTAKIVFRIDPELMDRPVLNRAAAFGRVDLDGDGRMDTVIGDPADTNTTVGVDADGDGEEGNDATPVGFGRLEASTVLAGKVKTNGGKSIVQLTTETTVRNVGTADLNNVQVDLPIPASLISAFLDIDMPVAITLAPTLGSEAVAVRAYNGTDTLQAVETLPVLKAGEEFSFSSNFLFNLDGLDGQALPTLTSSVRAELDRDGDGAGDQPIVASVDPSRTPKKKGKTIIDLVIDAQNGGGAAVAEATPAATLSTSGFAAASDGEVAAASAPALSTSGFSSASDGQAAAPAPALSTNGFAAASDGQAAAAPALSTGGFSSASDGQAAAPSLSTNGFASASDGQAAAPSLSTNGFDSASDGQAAAPATSGFAAASDGEASTSGFAAASDNQAAAPALSTSGFASASDSQPAPAADDMPQIASSVSSFTPAADKALVSGGIREAAGDMAEVLETFDGSEESMEAPMISDGSTNMALDLNDPATQGVATTLQPAVTQDQLEAAHSTSEAAMQQYHQQQASFTPHTGGAQQGGYQAPTAQHKFMRAPKVVKKLIPGPKIAFPEGAQPITVTAGYQLAVPQGYAAYRAPDGSIFLMRKR